MFTILHRTSLVLLTKLNAVDSIYLMHERLNTISFRKLFCEFFEAFIIAHMKNVSKCIGIRLEFIAPILATLLLLVWVGFAAIFDTAQFGDNVEQYIWAQSLEWGYHKHPPMPTWMLGGVSAIFGASKWWALYLSAFCFTVTLWLTWMIAKQLSDARAAAVAVLLWGLLQYFSSRLQMYNHNTVMVMWIAAVVWCALQTPRSPLWWLGAGIAAGAALLSKYQAVIPLTGVLFGLVFTGQLREQRQKMGLSIAILISLVVFAPHAIWVVQHDFITVRYASQSVETTDFLRRASCVLSFLSNQIRVAIPLILALLIYYLWMRLSPKASEALRTWKPTRHKSMQIWIWALFIGPMLFLLVLALVAGVHLRNQWGMQTLQFAPLWLAAWLLYRNPISLKRLATVVIVMQVAHLGVYAHFQQDSEAMASKRRLDTLFPAQLIADTGVTLWHSVTDCPLQLVVGDFEAGLVALYAGRSEKLFPAVQINAIATPWINAGHLRSKGALWVLPGHQQLPLHLTALYTLQLGGHEYSDLEYRSVIFAVQAPALPCKVRI
jgi:4-amino-4-deoxy-L-arabinose transferase-like glycosyltransferase